MMRLRGGVLVMALMAVACAAPTQTGDDQTTTISGTGSSNARAGKPDRKPGAPAAPQADPTRAVVLGPAAGILSRLGAQVVSNQGGQVVSNQGGTLAAPEAANAPGPTGYALAQVSGLFAPAAKASVVVTDVAGRGISGSHVSADAQGVVRLTRLAPAEMMIVYGSLRMEGFDVLLSAIVPAPAAGEALDVDPATTLVAKRLQALAALGRLELASVSPALPRALAKALAAKMTEELIAGAAVLDAQGAAQAFDAALVADPTLAEALKAVAGLSGELATAFMEPVPRRTAPSPLASGLPPDGTTSPPPSPDPVPSPTASPSPSPTPTPSPEVLAFEPVSAMPGQTISITVKHLAPGATVKIGGKGATITATTADRLDVTLPASAVDGTIAVTTGGVTLTLPGTVDVVDQAGVYDGGAQPGAMAVDISGTLWVANGDGNVTRLAQDGTKLGTFAVEAGPRRIVGAPDGSMWVSCTSGKVVKLDPFGEKVGAFDAGVDPWGLAVDAAGDVWVVNRSAQTLTHLDGTTGVVKRTSPVGIAEPEDLAWDATGDLWVSHGQGLNVTRGQVAAVSTVLGAASAPGGAAVASDGRILLAYRAAGKVGRLQNLDTSLWTVPVGSEPVSLGLGANGDVWVACQSGKRVLRLAAADGKTRGAFPFADAPAGLVVDPSGNVWVSRPALGKVVKFLP